MDIVVGTRGSELAVAQTQWIIDQILKIRPDINFTIKIIKTKGDRILNQSIDKIGGKGIFVKEIEHQLLDMEIDMAVHSLKDMPSESVRDLSVCKIPLREDSRDVMVFRPGIKSFEDLPKGARIGTGSKRRAYQLLSLRKDLEIVPIRGNIRTRIEKIKTENLEGIILAAAGLKRLGMEDKISYYFSVEDMIPSPGQGALAVQIRANDFELEKIVDSIYHRESNIKSMAERAYMKAIDGSCHIPMGAFCEIDGENIHMKAIYGETNGKFLVREEIMGPASQAVELGKTLAEKIIKKYNQISCLEAEDEK